jgi:hypothetical protein
MTTSPYTIALGLQETVRQYGAIDGPGSAPNVA